MRVIRGALIGLLLGAAALLFTATAAGADQASDEATFVRLINDLRASKGVGPLAVDGQLTDVARRWSARMAADGEISHNPSLAKEVTNWRLLGENVGVGITVERLHDAFVDSPAHYENLVEPTFTHVGIGVVFADGQMWVTETFKQPRTTTAAPAAAPRTTKPTAPPVAKAAPAPAVQGRAVTSPPRPRPRPVPVAASPTPTTVAPLPPTTVAPALEAPPTTVPAVKPMPVPSAPLVAMPAGNELQPAVVVVATALLAAVAVALRRPVAARFA